LDGCWIDFYHFSEAEGYRFNQQLRAMTKQDWDDQMRFMSEVGIKTAVMQNLFMNDQYLMKTNQTCDTYYGTAFYPSETFPQQFPFLHDYDKVEAIMTAADKYGINIMVGIGLFAWFDFREPSLCWHKKVMREVEAKYGHHQSFYGWYISEEQSGDFWKSLDPQYYYNDAVDDMVNFFATLKQTMTNPLRPIVLACNSYDWDKYTEEWKRVLKYVDILTPFALTRDAPNWHTLPAIIKTTQETQTRVWVDMELFSESQLSWTGMLVPKNSTELFNELQNDWNGVEQILAYEFTGLLDSPQSRLHLGGEDAARAYLAYQYYYFQFL